VDIWTIGSAPVSSSQYLQDIASTSEQSHNSIFFENLSPLKTTITQKLCSGKILVCHVIRICWSWHAYYVGQFKSIMPPVCMTPRNTATMTPGPQGQLNMKTMMQPLCGGPLSEVRFMSLASRAFARNVKIFSYFRYSCIIHKSLEVVFFATCAGSQHRGFKKKR
jgi:hypothetical protein